MNETSASFTSWHRDLKLNNRWPVGVGFFILFTCVFGFGVWAALAPIEGAVVASGLFIAKGQNKHIQHLEGGILREIKVSEGDMVEVNQILIRLDDTTANATLRRLVTRQHRYLAIRARLEAEIYGKPDLVVPESLKNRLPDQEIADIISRQRIELEATRTKQASEQAVLLKEIAGLKESIAGFQSRANATKSRMTLFQEELEDKVKLLDRQLTRKSEVLAIQRAEAGLAGELGELAGRIADARERIARAEQQIEALRSTAVQNAIVELRETEAALDDVGEQIRSARDVMERTEIRSPVKGIVVKIDHNTIGGVIAPGTEILEILPVDDELIIEARVDPNQISHLDMKQKALVRLTAVNQRVTPMIEGELVYLSADIVSRQNNPRAAADGASDHSFIVRIRLDQNDAREKAPDFRAMPGMPADVFIKTEDRTFLDYVLTPVTDMFSRAFRES